MFASSNALCCGVPGIFLVGTKFGSQRLESNIPSPFTSSSGSSRAGKSNQEVAFCSIPRGSCPLPAPPHQFLMLQRTVLTPGPLLFLVFLGGRGRPKLERSGRSHLEDSVCWLLESLGSQGVKLLSST